MSSPGCTCRGGRAGSRSQHVWSQPCLRIVFCFIPLRGCSFAPTGAFHTFAGRSRDGRRHGHRKGKPAEAKTSWVLMRFCVGANAKPEQGFFLQAQSREGQRSSPGQSADTERAANDRSLSRLGNAGGYRLSSSGVSSFILAPRA